MRIRSIKPEFWTSKTMAKFSWEDRLLLKALESYVDDNGVGKDDIELIVTSLFPRDYFQSPRETVAKVSEGISRLSQGFLVTRYDTEAESLLYIERWNEKQRVDKPQKGRYPRPDGSFEYSEDVDKSKYQGIREGFQNIPETVAPVTGEQGNRGTGEQGNSEPNGSGGQAAATSDGEPNAQTLIGEWIDNCKDRPPGRVIGQLSKEIKTLLDEGQDYQQVRTAVQVWNTKGAHPSVLPSVLHEIRNKRTQQNTSAVDRALERGRERHQKLENADMGNLATWDEIFAQQQIESST